MKKERAILMMFLFMLTGLFISSSLATAQEMDILGEVIPNLKKSLAETIGNPELDITGSIVGGYDSNYNLDRYDEDSSLFLQHTLGVYAKYPIPDTMFAVRGSYDLSSISYTKDSEPNLLDNALGVGIDAQILENYLWSVDYLVDFVGFPKDKFSEYTMNQVGTSLTHDVTDWLYHKLSYTFSHKHYPKWKTRNRWSYVRLGDRHDLRNTVGHEVGLYLTDTTFIRANNEVFFNDSNEKFLRYYDYGSFRTGAEVNQLITDKLYGSVNFAYQYKGYTKRGVSDDPDDDQRDHLFTYGGSLFYDITPNIAIGANCDYTNNISNENLEEYEDLIISSGVYCSF